MEMFKQRKEKNFNIALFGRPASPDFNIVPNSYNSFANNSRAFRGLTIAERWSSDEEEEGSAKLSPPEHP
jgi:hypothetical protein